jgi:hypothetical protein
MHLVLPERRSLGAWFIVSQGFVGVRALAPRSVRNQALAATQIGSA